MTDTDKPFQMAMAANPSNVMSFGDNPSKTLSDLSGSYHGNSQECVASVQTLNNLGRTATWKPLGPVGDDTQIGAPIAVFNDQGKYTNTPGQSHAATYLGVDADGNMIVGEQWNGKKWHTNVVPKTGKGGWRDASSYSVIGVNNPDEPIDEARLPSKRLPSLTPTASEPEPVDPSRLPSARLPTMQTATKLPETTETMPEGSFAERAMNAFRHGMVNDVMGPLVEGMQDFGPVKYMNKKFPALGRMDQNMIAKPGENEAYEKKFGNDIASQVGRFAGQTTAIAPALLGTEAVAAGAAARLAAPTVSKVLANPKLAGSLLEQAGSSAETLAMRLWEKAGRPTGVEPLAWGLNRAQQLLTKAGQMKDIEVPANILQKLGAGAIRAAGGAAQGAESAAASGDNKLQGAAGGATVRGAADAIQALANTNVVSKVLTNPAVVATVAGIGAYKAGAGWHALTAAVSAASVAALSKMGHQGTHISDKVAHFITNYVIAPTLKQGSGPVGNLVAQPAGNLISRATNQLTSPGGVFHTPPKTNQLTP